MQSHLDIYFSIHFQWFKENPIWNMFDSPNLFPKFQGMNVRKEPSATSSQKQTNLSNYGVFMMIFQSCKATIFNIVHSFKCFLSCFHPKALWDSNSQSGNPLGSVETSVGRISLMRDPPL